MPPRNHRKQGRERRAARPSPACHRRPPGSPVRAACLRRHFLHAGRDHHIVNARRHALPGMKKCGTAGRARVLNPRGRNAPSPAAVPTYGAKMVLAHKGGPGEVAKVKGFTAQDGSPDRLQSAPVIASTARERRSRGSGETPKAVLPRPMTATGLIYSKIASMVGSPARFKPLFVLLL